MYVTQENLMPIFNASSSDSSFVKVTPPESQVLRFHQNNYTTLLAKFTIIGVVVVVVVVAGA